MLRDKSIKGSLKRCGTCRPLDSARMLILVLSSFISALLPGATCSSAGNCVTITSEGDALSIPLKLCNSTFILLELNATDFASVYVLRYTSANFDPEWFFPNGDAISTSSVFYFVNDDTTVLIFAATQFACSPEGIYTCSISKNHNVLFGVYSSDDQCSSTHGELIEHGKLN